MQAFYSDQMRSVQEAEEAFELLQLAGANTEHLGFITAKLREQIDECGEPASLVPTYGDSKIDQRRWRLTAKLNYLCSQAWRLPIPIGRDTPLAKMRSQLEREYRELQSNVQAGKVSKGDLRRMASEAARKSAKQNALRR